MIELDSRLALVSSLHHAVGNQAVERLQENEILQPKLEVNQPGDKYEREAERLAEQVMEMSDLAVAKRGEREERRTEATAVTDGSGSGSETEQEQQIEGAVGAGEPLSATIQAGAPPIPTLGKARGLKSPTERTDASRVDGRTERGIMSHTGQPLSNSVRSFFEARFGEDFGDVRVHTDNRSDRLTRSLEAKAFTVGSDIFFRSEAYSPHSEEGKHLMAHELAHVVQQRSSPELSRRIQRWVLAAIGIAVSAIGAGASIAIASSGGDVEVEAEGSEGQMAGTKSGKQEYSEGNYWEGYGKVHVQMGSGIQESEFEFEEEDVGATVRFHYMRSIQDRLVGPVSFTEDGSDVTDTVGWGGDIDINAYPDPSLDSAAMIFSIRGTASHVLGAGHEGGATYRLLPNGRHFGESMGEGFVAWLE